MKKNMFAKVLCLVMVILLVVSLVGCGSKSEEIDWKSDFDCSGTYDSYADDGVTNSGSSSFGSKEELGYSTDESSQNNKKSVSEGRKIIETIYYSVQTKEFESLTNSLEERALSLGGYIESSDVYGNTYESVSYRNASYVFRIPSDKVDEFMTFIGENSTVTNKSVNTEDVTIKYVDTESRVKALELERDSLEELLENAKTTADIIKIRDMLTEVIYEIETNKTQLKTYDNLVDYTTVTVDVDEVEQTDIVHKQTTFERIGTDFIDSCLSVWNFLVEIFVFIVGSLPVILFIALIALVIFFVVRKLVKKAKKKQRKPFETPVVKKPETALNDENKTEE